jgi:LuxR family maltose regulon positive regulatory protein
VFDYLVEEVLQSRPEAQRRFLLQTAVLDRLRGDLCDALTGQHDGAQVLQRLEHDNVFVVALDDQRRWYRYHHLFADVLRVRLQAELPDDVAALHRRASVWFESMGMSVEAIGHALAAGDLDRAADLLQQTGAAVEEGSQAGTWLARARTLPERLIRERPALAVWFAYALLGTGELEAASSYLDDAESRLPGSPTDSAGFPGDGLRSLQGRIAVARAYLAAANGDSVAAVAHAGRALELVPAAEVARRDQATALLGMTYLADGDLRATDRVFTAYNRRLLAVGNLADAIGTGCLLADIRPVLGRLRLAVDTVAALEQAVLERAGAPPAEMADLYRAWAELDLVHGDVVAAGERLRRSGELGQLRAMPVWRYRWHLARARLRLAQGDHHAALDLLQEAQRLFVRTPMPDLRPVPAMRARIWAQQGRVGDALAWARERGLSSADDLDLVHEFEHLALAVILLADSRSRGARDAGEAAVALLDRLLHAAEDGGRVGSAIEILAIQATAHHEIGDARAAESALQRALTLAQPEGYLQVFLDQGLPMADLLRDASARQGSQGLAAAVLAAFPDPEARPEVPPLSVREVEVLQHIAAGLTNQEIASLLFVSPYTVKAHARSIYDKLGAHSRTAAVARARALGILAPR